jgi:O-antigen ligase
MAATTTSPAAHSFRRIEPAERGLWIIAGFGLLLVAAASGYALALHELEALYLSVALIACLAIMYDFRIGAACIVLLLPVADTSLLPRGLLGIVGLSPVNLLLAGTLASFLLQGRLQRAGRFAPPQLLWLYVAPIIVGALIGMPHVADMDPYFYDYMVIHFNNEPGYLREMLIKPMMMVLGALLLGAAVARAQKPERFIIVLAISVWLILALQLGFVAYSGVRLGWLASTRMRNFFDGIGLHANDLGRLYVGAYALLLFVWWETKQQALKTFLFITMLALCFGLMLTFSRGAFLGFLLVNGLMLAWKFNARSASLAVLAVVVAAIILPHAVYNRVMLGVDSGADAVSAGRIDGIWLPLLPEVLKHPLVGDGLGSIMWSFPMENGQMLRVGHPHNAFLETLKDMGLIGLTLLLLYYWHVWKGFRSLGSNAYLSPELRAFFQGATAGLLAFLVTGMSGSSLRPIGEFAYLWLSIGMMYGVLARRPPSVLAREPAP